MAFFGWIQFLDNDEGLVELSLTIKIFLTRLVLNSQPWSERLLFRSVEGREEKLRIKTRRVLNENGVTLHFASIWKTISLFLKKKTHSLYPGS